jgi:anti-anti-sigma factor
MMYRVRQEQSVEVIELSLPMQLDAQDFDRLSADLLGLVTGRQNGRWIVDLTGLQYMGSSVLGLMVNIRQTVKQVDGRLALCGMSPRLSEIFRTCCLERLFEIRPDLAAAVRVVLH